MLKKLAQEILVGLENKFKGKKMALSKKLTLKNNFDEDSIFNAAYIKVETYSGNKHQMLFDVNVYDKKEGQLVQKLSFSFQPNMDLNNFIAQAYLNLKTKEEFADAIDC